MALEPLVMHLVGQEVCSKFQCSRHTVVEAHHDLEVIVDFLVDDVSDVGKYGFELGAGEHPAELVQKVYAPVIEQDGREKRKNAELQLQQIESEMRQKLLEMSQ